MEDRASQYHREMSMFIMEEVDEGVTAPSKSEPGKLARLSSMQFQELATDVYDELKRRQSPVQGMPFLHVRDHYHPKRNQARQKLATLSRLKFVDLVHDVNEELKRRFPHKTEPSQRYTPSPHGMSYESLNMSPGYGAHPGQQQYQRSYSQNSSEHSPPISSESAMGYPTSAGQGAGAERGSAGNYNAPRGIARDGSFNSVDRLSNDPGHASNNGHQGPIPAQRAHSGEARGVYSPAGEIEKLKNEYESRLAAMRKRVGQLESQLLDNRGDNNPHDKYAEQLDNLERLNNVLTQKNERLENDIKIIHDQLLSTKADLPALRQENDQLRQERAQSIERERDLKARLDEARASIRKLKTTSVFAMDHGDADIVPPPVFVNSGGVIRPSSVRVFQEAVEALLSAVRSEDMEHELPAAQQAVDASCLGLKADVHGYQAAHASDPDAWPLSADVSKSVPGTLETLDINLRKLAEAVDKHLGSMGVLPVSLLEAAASHLATSVVDLVKLLKVCFDESKAAPRQQAGERQSLEESTDNIIAGIQNMLQLVRSSVPDPNALFSALQTVINSIRLTTAICREEFEAIESGSATSGQINTQLYSPQSARGVLSGLEKGNLQLTDQLNDISEAQEAAGDDDIDNEIVRELLSEMAFKQSLTSALIDVGKLTKTLVMWLE
ncbi:component of the polarisome [Coemansia guatemalensis]|uniref:Component of the polarisome n=1 Tax=Coemansia guatemalensis TaxID=2761395 RepID=A0A9W8HZJ3_9FUNG|nr:component of the polarisome [Coemansia guatemalensis]